MSTITVTNIKATGETASRPVSGVAGAWLDYNQSGPSIDDSYNISSVTDSAAPAMNAPSSPEIPNLVVTSETAKESPITDI